MIYAGGKGVTPNIPLSERFACEIQGMFWDDGSDLAKMLEAKRVAGATRVEFDVCESLGGRQLHYLCLTRDQARVDEQVTLAEKKFDIGGSPMHAAFTRVLAARKAYLDAHDAEEPNGNTGAVQSAMQDYVDIDRAWVQTLNDLAAGKLPHYTTADSRNADANLNRSYRQAITDTAGCEKTDIQICLTTDALRQIERAWIAYRDAWVAYGSLRWPAVSANSWKTWLTLQQIDDLNNNAI